MSRFAYERAIRRSGLPAPARHIALTLATWADVNTCLIPDRYMPSLVTLAEATGMGKSTIARHLPALEDEGWVARRQRKAPGSTHNEITHYTLTVPASAQAEEPTTEGVVPERDKGGVTAGQEVVPERDKGRPGAGHKSPRSSRSTYQSPGASAAEDRTGPAPERRDGSTKKNSITSDLDAAADAARQELSRAARREITPAWARKVALRILDAGPEAIERPAAYVRAAIRNEDETNLSRFLPTASSVSNTHEAFVPDEPAPEPERPSFTLHTGRGRRTASSSQPPLMSSVATEHTDAEQDPARIGAAAVRAALEAALERETS